MLAMTTDGETAADTRQPIGPARIAVPVIIVFIVVVASVMWIRLSGDAGTAQRIAVLPNGPTLSESLQRGWSEPQWVESQARVPLTTGSFRLGALDLDLATALRARDRPGAIDLASRIEAELGLLSDVIDVGPALGAFEATRRSLENDEPFAAARAEALSGELWLARNLEPADWNAGLFVEQGRIILRAGKMPPRSWQRELEGYLASNSLSPQIGAHLLALSETPIRSSKLRTLEILLRQLGDGRATWLRESAPGSDTI